MLIEKTNMEREDEGCKKASTKVCGCGFDWL